MGIYADTKLALKAYGLAKKGLRGKAISEAISTKRVPITTDEANCLAAIGRSGADGSQWCCNAAGKVRS